MILEIFLARKTLALLTILFSAALISGSWVAFYKLNPQNNQNKVVLSAKTFQKPTPSPAVIPSPTRILSTSSSPTPTTTSPNRSVMLGMWTQGFWDEKSRTLHPENLLTVEQKVGKHMAIAHYYLGWETLGNQSIIPQLQEIVKNGWRPMVSANPYFFDSCPANGKTLYKAIANGNCDAFLHSVGRTLKQFGMPILLRFAWEMNIDSISWSVKKTGDNSTDFTSAWKHFRDIVNSEGATNVLWVWSPNTMTSTSVPYGDLYPGNAYVDWTGLDGYNWGTTQPWSYWRSFSEIFSQSYNALVSLAPNKPLMLGEVNTTNVGGDKSLWYTDMLSAQIPLNFSHIKAIVFYNEDRTSQENVNWLIDINQPSLSAFSKGINNPIYVSSF